MSAALCSWMVMKFASHPKQWVRLMQTANFARKILSCTSLGLAIAKCKSGSLNLSSQMDEPLTHEQCIKQACILSVNSASTLLTTTSAALLDVCEEYKDALNKILSLLEELQTIEGENPALWDEIVEARAKVNKAKATLTELNSFMESVEKVVNSTTETTFLVGAEYMCTTLCERLYSAQKEVNGRIMELKQLEEDYIKVQKEIVKKKKESESRGRITSQETTSPGNSKGKLFL